MTVLDTNVLSALVQPTPEEAVLAWLDRQATGSVWITAVTVFEIRMGLDLMPRGWQRQYLEDAYDRLLAGLLSERVLPFDVPAAQEAGQLAAARRQRGFTDEIRDIQIAGIVVARGATLATRNVRHFHDLGARVIDPWASV